MHIPSYEGRNIKEGVSKGYDEYSMSIIDAEFISKRTLREG
jgi:hypothetical protein